MRRLIAILLTCLAIPLGFAVQKPAAAIASSDPLATRAGMQILKQGGNAFDAAVAVAAVLAVVEPADSGIGGGGFWLLHVAKKNRNVFVDAREQAPGAATPDMYNDKQGQLQIEKMRQGALAAAIPGEPAALAYLAKHYGRLSLATDLAPAIQLAKQGFTVNRLYRDLAKFRFSCLMQYPKTANLFLPDGKIPAIGQRIRQKELADTLQTLAQQGRKGFYQGRIAKLLVSGVRQSGGIWQLSDLKNYRIKIRKPLVGHYHGAKLVLAPLPSAGGITMLTILNILSGFNLADLSLVNRVHLLVEAMRLAYRDRVYYLGDSDYVHVPVNWLISMKHAKQLRQFINLNKATPSRSLPRLNSKALLLHDNLSMHTTHYSILDQQGNRVAATLSINYPFGSCFIPKSTGVLLNNEMDDFSISDVANLYGLQSPTTVNAIAPDKRPLSSMSPTFVTYKNQVAIVGTPGGSRIPTMVLLAILDFMQGKKPASWVAIKRFHHQYLPDEISYEKDALSDALKAGLIAKGHRLRQYDLPHYGDMQAILWNKNNNSVLAASDPRGLGLAQVQQSH